jgi:hypothetical protein
MAVIMDRTLFLFCVFLSILVAGCNTQTVTGAARERLVQPTPYGARWIKEGITRENRKIDWVKCGGGADLQDGFRRWVDPESRKSYFDSLDRHEHHLRTCMQSKGYTYRNPQMPGKADECDDGACLYP